jgi:hypothetical protein
MFGFRGKTERGQWVEGYFIEGNSLNEDSYKRTHKCLILPIYPDIRETNIGLISINGLIEVIPESVAMSTGLKDKNGKEIFGSIEIDGKMSRGGDIVKWDDRSDGKYWRYAKVIFEYGMFGFEIIKAIPDWSCEIGFKFIGNFAYQEETEKELEIVTNQFDNPDLLEKEQ